MPPKFPDGLSYLLGKYGVNGSSRKEKWAELFRTPAGQLGANRTTLYKKMKRLGLEDGHPSVAL